MGKMLLSGLVLSRWCEYHLMQWSLSRKMTSNRARYLNQDLIVLVRCRKPVIFRVGICVGIGWCCLLLTILNHEVKSHVRVRPSHQKYVNRPQLRSFFMPEIQQLPTFFAILTLSRSTDINVHLPTHVGTDDGISGSIMLVPTGRG